MKRITETELPAASRLHSCLECIDYQDAYWVEIDRLDASIGSLYGAVFGHAPAWVNRLMELRNLLVAPLGLKTESEARMYDDSQAIEVGAKLGIFRVFYIDEREIIVGEDDRHLDFRISLFKQMKDTQQPRLVVSTQVQFHNRLGRWYMALIRPFHRYLARYILRSAANQGRI